MRSRFAERLLGGTVVLAAVFLGACDKGGTCSSCTAPSVTYAVSWSDGTMSRFTTAVTVTDCSPTGKTLGGSRTTVACAQGCQGVSCAHFCACAVQRPDDVPVHPCACADELSELQTPQVGCDEGFVCAMGRCIPEGSPGETCYSN